MAALKASTSATAQPLHIGPEFDDRAVLVEDDEVDAVEPDGHTSAPTSELASAPSRAAPSTKHASGGNEIVTAWSTSGSRQMRLVERVERDQRRCRAVRAVTES